MSARAGKRAVEGHREARVDNDVADTIGRAPGFVGRCYVCGWPTRSGALFCVGHSDLAGVKR